MSDAAALIARLRSKRETWCELDPGKAVQLRRPAETEVLTGMLQRTPGGGTTLQVEKAHVCAAAVGWRGITEADLLGAGVGVDDAVPFDAGVWAEVVADRADWLQRAAAHLLDQITKHFEAQDTAAKNSGATSLPGPAATEAPR
jgi:hypothetical protein